MVERIKKKIKDKTLKNIIDWRLLALLLNIILIQKLLLFLNFSLFNILLILFFVLNIYILDKTLIYLYWYNNFKIEVLYFLKNGSEGKIPFEKTFVLVQSQLESFSYDSLFFCNFRSDWRFNPNDNFSRQQNSNYYHNRLLYDYINWGFWGRLDEGRDYFNKYWLNSELYYADIIGGLNIADLNDFFLHFNLILERKSKLKYQLNLLKTSGLYNTKTIYYGYGYRCSFNIKNVKKKSNNTIEKDLLNINSRCGILTKTKYLSFYEDLKRKKHIIDELYEINEAAYTECIKILNLLDEFLQNNGQQLVINTNISVIMDTRFYRPEWSDTDNNQIKYYEMIYNNYDIDNNNYNLRLNFKKFYFKTKVEVLRNLDKDWLTHITKNKVSANYDAYNKYNGYNKGLRLIPIYLSNDDVSKNIYAMLDLEKYQTYYMNERLEVLNELIKTKNNINLNKKINKNKIYANGSLVKILTKEEFILQQERIKEIRNNVSVLGLHLRKK